MSFFIKVEFLNNVVANACDCLLCTFVASGKKKRDTCSNKELATV